MLDLAEVASYVRDRHGRFHAPDECLNRCASVLMVIAALRAVLDTPREELAAVWSGAFVDPLVAPRVAEQALAYLRRKAGVTP